MIRHPPRSPLFPSTTLFRSDQPGRAFSLAERGDAGGQLRRQAGIGRHCSWGCTGRHDGLRPPRQRAVSPDGRADRETPFLLHGGFGHAAVGAEGVPAVRCKEAAAVLERHAGVLRATGRSLMDALETWKTVNRADLLQMYYYLRLTRTLEDRITALYRQGRIVGGVYTGNGMEAIAVGYASALERDDIIAPFHRDMGAFLVRGITPGEVIAQYLGKRGGPTKGKDSNVHIGDLKRGVIGFVSHLADNLPVATGVALAFKMRAESRVVITNTGDGGTSRGDFHEAMNFAAVRKLPVVFFCNNNQYAYSTPLSLQIAIPNVVDRAQAYGMPGEILDGNG